MVQVFPNAISIKTKQTEYMFRSFLHRDECHSLLTAMWKNFKDFEKTGGRKTGRRSSNHHVIFFVWFESIYSRTGAKLRAT